MNSAKENSAFWVNGRKAESICLTDRGLAYGDGLFETVRFHRTFMPLWSFHQERLHHGAQVLGMPLSDEDVNRYAATALAFAADCGIETGVMKLIVTRGAGARGYAPPVDPEPTIIISTHPFAPQPDTARAVRLNLCEYRLSHNTVLAGIKHLNRLEQVLAAMSVQLADDEQGLVIDQQGYLVETLHHNIFLVKEGALLTPDLNNCGVAGTLRRAILQRFAPALGLSTRITQLTLEDLADADEVFICNSVRGVTPVVQWTNSAWPIGPVTRRVMNFIAREWDDFYDC